MTLPFRGYRSKGLVTGPFVVITGSIRVWFGLQVSGALMMLLCVVFGIKDGDGYPWCVARLLCTFVVMVAGGMCKQKRMRECVCGGIC